MMVVPESDQGSDVELDRLLEAIFERYHYDFRHYARPYLLRRVAQARASLGNLSTAALVDRVAAEPATFATLLGSLTVQVSELFRDPGYYAAIRREVVPHLATYPSLRIWVAGCGAGEEAYSMAILLHEENLLERALIYATDIDTESLRVGKDATYDLDRVRSFSENYFHAGGRASLSDYYTAAYSRVSFDPHLRKHVLFTDHCLATDAAFAEVQLVSCRNVLIYFDRELQDRATGLFRESLCPRGFLWLGSTETLAFGSHAAAFEVWAGEARIYRLK
jgi:chemotaxis protein methyltransferase CheR